MPHLTALPSQIALSRPQYHVAIIGAGLGGLAASIGIAKAGHKVTIIEQAAALGEVSHFPPRASDILLTDYRLAQAFKSRQTLLVSCSGGEF